jgi:cytochrome c oxidase assembly factor CtaG
MFAGSALLFWWPVIGPAPRLRRPASLGARIVYLVLAAFQGAALGLLLAVSPRVVYETYADSPLAWGIDPLDDQRWGGILMWGVGSVIEMAAVLVLLLRLFSVGEPRARAAPVRPSCFPP